MQPSEHKHDDSRAKGVLLNIQHAILQTKSSARPIRNTIASEACIVVADSQAGGEKAKDQERLRASLVLDIILDRVWDEVLVLEVDLRTQDATILMTG